MRKQVAILLTVFFLISLSFTANAAIKPGNACKKFGSTSISSGKKYTCVKSGKKLIWNKGVITKSPTLTPTPPISPTPSTSPSSTISSTPAPTPTPTSTTGVNYSAEFTEIANDWNLQLVKNSAWEPQLDIYISPNISSTIKSQYADRVIEQIQVGRKILKSFGFEFSPKYSFALFTEKDKEWVRDNFAFFC